MLKRSILQDNKEFKAEEAVDNGNGVLSLVEPTPQRRPGHVGSYMLDAYKSTYTCTHRYGIDAEGIYDNRL